MTRVARIVVGLAIAAICTGCGGLPSNFQELPLEEKIAACDKHFRQGGRSLLQGQAYISRDGWEAAERTVPHLEGKEWKGIPPQEAVTIIWDVQLLGCDLEGTKAEKTVERLLNDASQLWELRFAAEGALEAIRGGEFTGTRGSCRASPRVPARRR